MITLNAAPGLTTVTYKVQAADGTFGAAQTNATEVQPGLYQASEPVAGYLGIAWYDGLGGSGYGDNTQGVAGIATSTAAQYGFPAIAATDSLRYAVQQCFQSTDLDRILEAGGFGRVKQVGANTYLIYALDNQTLLGTLHARTVGQYQLVMEGFSPA